MHNLMNKNITIEYDEEMLLKLKEMIEEGWMKLKSFVKINTNQKAVSKQKPNLDFYHDLKEKFKNISIKLKELKLCEELRYFLSVSHLINYIVYENSLNSSFGHCCFAIELLKFFIRLFKTNLQFYNKSYENYDFQKTQREFEKIHFNYIREFYWNIYQPDTDFDENNMYEYAKSLRVI